MSFIKKSYKMILNIIFIAICIFGIIYTIVKINNWQKDLNSNTIIKENLKRAIDIDTENDQYVIDWESLKLNNPDTVAYLKVNNTNINYVVVRTKNNSYYLTHNFNKKNNRAGWIFMDYHNKLDGSDRNIIIYGHNAKDGSMFESLKSVLKKSWYDNEDNNIIYLGTEAGLYKYQVFSIYKIENEDYYINTEFDNDKEYLEFLNTLKNRSIKKYDVNLNERDKILTLSTCSEAGAKRIVLHAKLIK